MYTVSGRGCLEMKSSMMFQLFLFVHLGLGLNGFISKILTMMTLIWLEYQN